MNMYLLHFAKIMIKVSFKTYKYCSQIPVAPKYFLTDSGSGHYLRVPLIFFYQENVLKKYYSNQTCFHAIF